MSRVTVSKVNSNFTCTRVANWFNKLNVVDKLIHLRIHEWLTGITS